MIGQKKMKILILFNSRSSIHLTSIVNKKVAGRYKSTPNRSFPLTYEQSLKPDKIGVSKSWNNFNTSSLLEGIRRAETAQEDIVIRRMIQGMWPGLLASEVIIKRRANMIILNYFVLRRIDVPVTKVYFLIGFTEEILSCLLKSIVKVEIQTIDDYSDLVHTYI